MAFDTELKRRQIFWGRVAKTKDVPWEQVLDDLEEACDEIDRLRKKVEDKQYWQTVEQWEPGH